MHTLCVDLYPYAYFVCGSVSMHDSPIVPKAKLVQRMISGLLEAVTMYTMYICDMYISSLAAGAPIDIFYTE